MRARFREARSWQPSKYATRTLISHLIWYLVVYSTFCAGCQILTLILTNIIGINSIGSVPNNK